MKSAVKTDDWPPPNVMIDREIFYGEECYMTDHG